MNPTPTHTSPSVASHSCTKSNCIQQRIEQLLKDRLQKLGSIRTDDAWQICRKEYQYGTIAFHFKCIMLQLVSQGKAERIRNGLYWISKK